MLNARMFRALGISIPIITVIILSGILVDVNEVLFNTGIKPLYLVVIGNIFLAYNIWKNKI